MEQTDRANQLLVIQRGSSNNTKNLHLIMDRS